MNRKVLLAIAAFLLCISLSFTKGANATAIDLKGFDRSTTAQQAASDRIEIARQFIQSLEAKDVIAVNELLAENVVLEQPFSQLQLGGVRVEGRQAANQFFDRIFRQYSQIRFVDAVFRQSQFDNAVILEGRGDFRVASNQSPYRNQYVGVLEVVDGRIALIREYFNPLIVPEA